MPYLDKETTKEVRKNLKKEFPEFKFSVRTKNYSTLDVSVLSGPLDLLKDSKGSHQDINHFYVDKHYEDFPEKKDFLLGVLEIMSDKHVGSQHRDVDYGSIPNFYLRLSIGRREKPYTVK